MYNLVLCHSIEATETEVTIEEAEEKVVFIAPSAGILISDMTLTCYVKQDRLLACHVTCHVEK